jgi:hypothetical protein
MDQLAEPADDAHTEPSLHERHSERNAAEGKFPGVGKDPLQRGGVTLATIDWKRESYSRCLKALERATDALMPGMLWADTLGNR